MRMRNPRNIQLDLMSSNTVLWNDENAKRHCDDPLCNEKVNKNSKTAQFFEDKNNNKIPDFFEKPFKKIDKNKISSSQSEKINLKKKLKKWI